MGIAQIPTISTVSQHVRGLAIKGRTPIKTSVSVSRMTDVHALLLKQFWIFTQEENALMVI